MNIKFSIYNRCAILILALFSIVVKTTAQNALNNTVAGNLPLASLAMITMGWENDRPMPAIGVLKKDNIKKETILNKPPLQLPDPSILSSDYLNFNSIVSDNNAILQWKTSNLPDADALIVEQSTDGTLYQEVSAVMLNIEEKINGIIIPQDDGLSYYRLKILNKDGSTAYTESLTCKVNTKGSGTVSVYPASITDEWLTALTIITDYRGKIKVVVTDDHGRQLIEFHREIISERSKIPIGVATIPKGAYYIFVSGKDGAHIGTAQELIRN